MLKLRKRGRIYHVRGTVRVGKKIQTVKEHSTGLDRFEAADQYRARLESEIRQELLHGAAGRVNLMTVADCFTVYLQRPEGLGRMDVWRVGQLNEYLGDRSLLEARDGWNEFVKARCAGLAPATVDRFRAILVAALNYGCEHAGIEAPKIPSIAFKNVRVRWFTTADAELLQSCYVEHVQPIIRGFRYQGLRTQEALQLDWLNVDLRRETVFIERTKNGAPRTVELHPKFADGLWTLWKHRNHPTRGHVFLNRLGKPYADTRDYKFPGGNPLRSAHGTAFRRAGVRPNGGADFTVHDWRHHWASWFIMEGGDLLALKEAGGWKSLRMVERYAAVSPAHVGAAIKRAG